jgi:RNA 3'-phosphate cyclase
MIALDGNYGEGGGQIVRTALALSMLTQKPFHVKDIRKGRKEPGLKAQHLYCIKALQKLSQCDAKGAELGSMELEFYPAPITGTRATINIGTAGSTTLLLQAILLPCMFAQKPITLTIKGGTDTKWATPIDHFRFVLLPQVQKFADVNTRLIRRGYYPRGNGEIEVSITPKMAQDGNSDFLQSLRKHIEPYALVKKEKVTKIVGIVHCSSDLKKNNVAERIAQGANQLMTKHFEDISIKKEYNDTNSTGCGITLWAAMDNSIIGADALGERNIRAEDVGKQAAEKLLSEISGGAVIDVHTADALIPFVALSGGSLKTSAITPHIQTNIYAVEAFLGKKFSLKKAKNLVSTL